jgi:hypothetical protein
MATKTKPKTKTPKWKTIKDDKVIHVWECLKCGEKAEVNPTFYEESGTPVCSGEKDRGCDGDDMTYVKTQIRV